MLKLSHSRPQVLDDSVAGLRVYVLKDLPACGFSRSNLALLYRQISATTTFAEAFSIQ